MNENTRREYMIEWRKRNKEKITQYTKDYYRKNKERMLDYCKQKNREHPRKTTEYNHKHGITKPMSENRKCSKFLGEVIAEEILSREFKNITRMPQNNKGFDYICSKGYKIDVKSACMSNKKHEMVSWCFNIKRNKTPNYFLCIAFNNREELKPLHLWLIPGNEINEVAGIEIFGTCKSLDKYKKWERPLDNAMECCNKMRET